MGRGGERGHFSTYNTLESRQTLCCSSCDRKEATHKSTQDLPALMPLRVASPRTVNPTGNQNLAAPGREEEVTPW